LKLKNHAKLPSRVCCLILLDDDDDDVQCCNVHLTRSQLSLAHNAKVKADMPEKKENSWSLWSQYGGWKGRITMEDSICGKDEF